MRRLTSKVTAGSRPTAVERIGDRLFGRFLPRADAQAACCGSCCGTGIYRCTSHGAEQLYNCYTETFEGCYVYRQVWRNAGLC
ncbi:hypothetical protein Q0Z83_060810 [Actinoplanes sichuanensis]|uniref:Uncharacterized protein n=1 Tax=Actinoplanes sichuanensis TaxID=512349 RepID=A0ABW4A7V8_9ACTN|nr:hypothetical protein [Actinoplanes sichuanensis]BEL07890.1 hypothetical protein Q0Z83_060810 [Actinoplanes sichuanensis]